MVPKSIILIIIVIKMCITVMNPLKCPTKSKKKTSRLEIQELSQNQDLEKSTGPEPRKYYPLKLRQNFEQISSFMVPYNPGQTNFTGTLDSKSNRAST